ncbi:discoidin domain-containing protein [Paenibacillus sp. PAMC21692]|uniref:discoidin domain-containing protein n=1 Tax=Paenibacillus sp. PAMC21692 TaxID=2762320 RepID=UPI00164E74AF|nr:discoidin domain-containing protein [Paenibacillus sp. PAMC21692]QNK59399.1 discoidin domain-containing protein [Paenibacillus sp. PAMC21692]
MNRSVFFRKKSCVLALCIFVWFGTIHWAPSYTKATPIGAWQFSTEFGSLQGEKQWYYRYWNGTSYMDMSYDTAGGFGKWKGNEDRLLLWKKGFSPGLNSDAALGWKAPGDMTISITGNMIRSTLEPQLNGDGNRVKIMKVSGSTITQIWPSSGWQVLYPGQFATHALVASVLEDDFIYFQVNKDGANSNDIVYWDPVIRQDEIPLFTIDKTEMVMSPNDYDRMQMSYTDTPVLPIYQAAGDPYWIHSDPFHGFTKMRGPADHPSQTFVWSKTQSELFENPNGHDGYWWLLNIVRQTDGSLLAVCQVGSAGPSQDRYRIGLARSTDEGDSWTYLGNIVTQFGDPANVNIGGGVLFIKDGYYYTYFLEYGSQGIQAAVARAPISEVMVAAANDTVSNWYKYYDGNWTEAGLGGNYTPLNATSVGANVTGAYNTYNNKYYVISGSAFSSTDLIHWTDEGEIVSYFGVVPDARGPFPFYTSYLDGDGTATDLQVGQSFYIYFMQAHKWDVNNPLTEETKELYRTKVTKTSSSMDTFLASEAFGSTQGEQGWHYQEWDGSNYTDMTWDAVNGRWTGSYSNNLIMSNVQHPDVADSVRKWIAPMDGTVNIRAHNGRIATSSSAGGDGVQVRVLYENSPLWPSSGWQYVGGNDTISMPERTIRVAAGDAIYFIVNQYGNNISDATEWNPVIEYVKQVPWTRDDLQPVKYQASADYGITQQKGAWSYQQSFWNSHSYDDMNWDYSMSMWKGSEPDLLIWDNGMHPDVTDAVRKWVAPFNGTVEITMNDGHITLADTRGDGVQAKVLKGTDNVWPSIGYTYIAPGTAIPFPKQTVNVQAGDPIYFIVSRSGNHYFDSTSMDPVITYVPFSQNKTVTASSGSVNAALAVDGNDATNWMASDGAMPQWLKVDLGQLHSIKRIDTKFNTAERWKYRIEGSIDNVNWSVVTDESTVGTNSQDATIGVYSFYGSLGSYRYVKITILDTETTWASIKEFKIY